MIQILPNSLLEKQVVALQFLEHTFKHKTLLTKVLGSEINENILRHDSITIIVHYNNLSLEKEFNFKKWCKEM